MYSFADLFWSMIIFYFIFMVLWIFIRIFADIFHRQDISGGTVFRLAATRPKGAWITTMPLGMPPFYLDPSAGLAERRWPTRADKADPV